MTVFRGYLLIIRRYIATIMMYIVIFAAVTLGIQQAYVSTGIPEGFSAMRIRVAVIDRDGKVLGETLKKLIGRSQELVELPDERGVLQEALYYGDVEYILVIPEGAQERLIGTDGRMQTAGSDGQEQAAGSGTQEQTAGNDGQEQAAGNGTQEQAAGNDVQEGILESITAPESVTGFYVSAQVDMLLNQIRVLSGCGYSFEEACAQALALGEKQAGVELLDINGNEGLRPDYNYYFAYMPYAFLGGAIMSAGFVIMEFKRRDIRRRMESCAVPLLWQNIAALCAVLLIGVVIWSVCILLHVAVYRGGVFTDGNGLYYILNSLACLLVALSLGYFAGMCVNSPTALNGINNVLSLGLCFLGGIFVPIEMLGSGVGKLSRFLPTWWYSRINGILGDYGTLSKEMRTTVWQGLVIQLVFASAMIGISLAVRRMRMQEKE